MMNESEIREQISNLEKGYAAIEVDVNRFRNALKKAEENLIYAGAQIDALKYILNHPTKEEVETKKD
jgi:pheromone shutdown protein TraB